MKQTETRKTEFIILRVERELKEKLIKKADMFGRKLSAYIREILREIR